MPQAGSSIDEFYFKNLGVDVIEDPLKVRDFQTDHSDYNTQCPTGIDEFHFEDLLQCPSGIDEFHFEDLLQCPSGIDEFHFNDLDIHFRAQEMVDGQPRANYGQMMEGELQVMNT